jgi:hypothetical protein
LRIARLDGYGSIRGNVETTVFEAFKELLKSSFALLDFSTVPLTEVFSRALNFDHQQLGLGLCKFHALAPLPRAKEKAFVAVCVVHDVLTIRSIIDCTQ